MNIKELSVEIDKGLRSFKAFEKGREVLDKLVSLEEHATNLEKSLPILKSERDTLLQEIEGLKSEAAELEIAAQKIITDANAAAEASARAVKDKALADRDDLLNVANDHLTKQRAALAEDKDRHENHIAGLRDQSAAELEKLAALKAETSKVSGDLDVLKSHTKKVLESFGG